jgi:putative transposase
MFASDFPKVIKYLLKDLPKKDYPVLNTFFFTSCWLGWVMDQSLVSMRDLIFRLNSRNIKIDISTFSKASKTRDTEVFEKLLEKAIKSLKKKKGTTNNKIYFPLDSTIITLTSKLLWSQDYHQVKLFCGINNWTNEVGGIVINFGQGHDSKYGEKTVEEIPENGIGIMDRGFASQLRIRKLLERENKFFVLRIKNNMKLEILDNGNSLLGGGKDQLEVRIVNFCNLENRSEFRLATNLNSEEFSQEEIGEVYRCRWGIETFWKFLKMHLKLDRLMTKNENGIRIQIYSCLIVYIILQLIEISQEIGVKILDKLRYLQSFMNEKISYIHWFRRLSFSW